MWCWMISKKYFTSSPLDLFGPQNFLAVAQDVLRPKKVSGTLGKVFPFEIIQPPFTFPVK